MRNGLARATYDHIAPLPGAGSVIHVLVSHARPLKKIETTPTEDNLIALFLCCFAAGDVELTLTD